jgi:ABC-type oligopeptide transport system ATPase subunit
MLELKDISVHFTHKNSPLSGKKQVIKAVDKVCVTVNDKEILGLVGESGCGKTTLGKAAIRLIEPTSGQVVLDGTDITKMGFRRLKKFRSKMQIIFQDPISSINPRQTIYDVLEEPLKIHTRLDRGERKKEIERLIDCVAIAKNSLNRYSHQFSGGQCQRIAIARALSVKPKLIIADEPVSSLDVSVQAQILNLMLDLKKEFGLSYLFISHNLAVINHIADRVAVMFEGKIAEEGKCCDVINNPRQDYTKSLLEAVPKAL